MSQTLLSVRDSRFGVERTAPLKQHWLEAKDRNKNTLIFVRDGVLVYTFFVDAEQIAGIFQWQACMNLATWRYDQRGDAVMAFARESWDAVARRLIAEAYNLVVVTAS